MTNTVPQRAAAHLGILVALVAAATDAGAQASTRKFDPELLHSGDLIRYRDLRRDDFRAKEPPAEIAATHGQLGAATCAFLTTDPSTYIQAASRGRDLELRQVRAQVRDLGFVAYMDRGCSWWNPAPLALPDDYILQHEQIHFALFEITARRLNGRAAQLMRRLETVSSSQQRAIDEAQRKIDAELQAAMDELLLRSDEFDRETSRAYRRERQESWWRAVSEELDRLPPPDSDR